MFYLKFPIAYNSYNSYNCYNCYICKKLKNILTANLQTGLKDIDFLIKGNIFETYLNLI